MDSPDCLLLFLSTSKQNGKTKSRKQLFSTFSFSVFVCTFQLSVPCDVG